MTNCTPATKFIFIWVTIATLSPFLITNAISERSNILRSENVFGWQKERASSQTANSSRSRASSSRTFSPSPLRQSENVFGWQQRNKSEKHSPDGIHGDHHSIPARGSRHRVQLNGKTSRDSVLHTKAGSDGSGDNSSISNIENNSNNFNQDENRFHNHQHLPSIKLQPRKKELWLPWPLGALRNDFHRFAADQRTRQNDQWGQKSQQSWLHHQHNENQDRGGILHQSRDWATRMVRNGGALLPMPKLFHRGQNTGIETSDKLGESSEVRSQPRYWGKDTTTPMATASATMRKNKNESNNGRGENSQKQVNVDKGVNSKEVGLLQHLEQSMVVKYLKLQASIRLRQLGYVGSDLSVHLPPSSPTLLLLYMLPSKQDPMRRLVKFTLTGATVSWIHSEATKYRKFAPLPGMKGINVRRPNLPPFLPEELDLDQYVDAVKSERDVQIGLTDQSGRGNESGGSEISNNDKNSNENVEFDKNHGKYSQHDQHHHHWDPFGSFGTISSAYRTWLENQALRDKQLHHQRRKRTQSELLALQQSASNSSTSGVAPNLSKSSSSLNTPDTGYALITGASRGIGRAIAIELARYRIPLILVARDVSKLTTVARDIETYYNVPCHIISADLASPGSASQIHSATTKAGLKVDILINNAGVCTRKEMVEESFDDSMRMLQVNVGSVVQLSQLYGKDMKERRRGRMLFVSSMSGALPGCPGVSLYAATKSFEKSLASSLGREMEKYGVGVTCLLPGAVNTNFASSSEVEDAVCFQVPGYAKSPELVAGEGVKAMMLGYPEVLIGWQNRLFMKFGVPMLPSRVSNLIAEYAWSPWQWGGISPQLQGDTNWAKEQNLPRENIEEPKRVLKGPTSSAPPNSPSWRFRRSPPAKSNLLQLPEMPDTNRKQISEKSPQQHSSGFPGVTNNIDIPNPPQNPPAQKENETKSLEIDTVQQENENLDNNIQTPTSNHTSSNHDVNEKDENVPPLLPENQIKRGDLLDKNPTSESQPLQPVPQSSSQFTFFNFADKENKNSPPSLSDIDASKGTSSNDRGDTSELEGGSVDSYLFTESNGTWYPSMLDRTDYDFRDRRLDYSNAR